MQHSPKEGPLKWENVYLFISSTFGDMHAERDYLVKRVFPQLQEWCEQRRLHLIDVDLRWGVTESAATSRNAVKVCLDFIDRCRPFFLCFLGQRYGWIPRAEAAQGDEPLSPDTYERFQGLKPVVDDYSSVTEIEVLHALLRPFPAGNEGARLAPSEYSFFYFRRPSYLFFLPKQPSLLLRTYCDLEGPPEEPPDLEKIYADSGPAGDSSPDAALPAPGSPGFSFRKLRALKARVIARSGRPCHFYSATWLENARTPELALPIACPSTLPSRVHQWRERWWNEASVTAPGMDVAADPASLAVAQDFNSRLTAGRLGDFRCDDRPLADVILDDLKAAIEARYPGHQEAGAQDELHRELEQHEEFIYNATQVFVERAGDFEELNHYVDSDDRCLLVLTAEGGLGKSTLLARWIAHLQERAGTDSQFTVHFRFVGVGEHSASIEALLSSFVQELEEAGKLEPWQPSDPKELREQWPRMLAESGSRGKTILIIDALNQLETGLADLEWLPRPLPEGVKLIVSFRTGDPVAGAAVALLRQDDGALLTRLRAFEHAEDRRKLVRAYLSQFLKELDSQHLEALIRVEGAQNPLYLKVVLSELRVFGSYEQLGAEIGHEFGGTPVSAFDALLRRLESDPAYTPIKPGVAVPLLFGFLAYARAGLPEDLLAGLMLKKLSLEDRLDNRGRVIETIRHFLRQVRPFMARRGGRSDFFYDSFSAAARGRYTAAAPGEGLLATEWHTRIAAECERWSAWQGQSQRYALANLVYHSLRGSQLDAARRALEDVVCLYTRIEALGRESVYELVADYSAFEADAKAVDDGGRHWKPSVQEWARFVRSIAHVVARLGAAGFLQAAKSISDDSPISLAADRFAEQTRLDRCWLEKINRPKRRSEDPRVVVLSDSEGQNPYVVHYSALAFDPAGRKLFGFDHPSGFKAWELDSGRLIRRVAARRHTAWLLMPESSRALLAEEADDCRFRLWDLEKGECLQVFTGHTAGVVAFAMRGSRQIISASEDGTVRVWDSESGVCVKVLPVRADGLHVLPGEDRVLLSCADSTTRLFEIDSGRSLAEYPGGLFLAFQHGQRLLTTAEKDRLRICNFETGAIAQSAPLRIGLCGGQSFGILKVHPDGRRLIYVDNFAQVVSVVSVDTGEAIRTLTCQGYGIREVHAHPDGDRVILAGQDGVVRVWNLRTGAIEHAFHHQGPVAVALHPKGRVLATMAADQLFRVWDLTTGRLKRTRPAPAPAAARIIYDTTGWMLIVLPQGSGQFYAWSPAFRRWYPLGEPHHGPVEDVASSPEGDLLLAICEDGTLRVHTLLIWPPGKCITVFKGHSGSLRSAGFLGDNRHVVSADTDGIVLVWDALTGAIEQTLHGENLAVVQGGPWFMYRNRLLPLHLYDLTTSSWLRDIEILTTEPEEVRLHPDQKRLLAIDAGGKALSVWDLETGSRLRSFANHDATFHCVAHLPDGKRFLSADSSSEVILWETEAGRIVRRFPASAATVLTASEDNRLAASASEPDGKIQVWDLSLEADWKPAASPRAGISLMELVPGSPRLVAASTDRRLRVWNTGSMICERVLDSEGSYITALASHPDGRRVLAGAKDGSLTVWDVVAGRITGKLAGHADRVVAAAVLPDGQRVISASSDCTLRLWDLGGGNCIRTLTGHAAAVRVMTLHPDGRTVFSAADDETIRRWELDSGNCLWTSPVKGVVVNALAVHPDGQHLLSLHMDPYAGKSPEVGAEYWDCGTGQLMAALKGVDNSMSARFLPDSNRVLIGLTLNKMIRVGLDAGIVEGIYTCGDVDIPGALSHLMDLHPSAKYAVTACGHLVRLWDVASCQNLASWYEEGIVEDCRFVPDVGGVRIVYGSSAGELTALALKNERPGVKTEQDPKRGFLFNRAYLLAGQKMVMGPPQHLEATPPQSAAENEGHRSTGRNDPCPCGSGKKYKKCHGH